jgi:hypothetical protein
MYNKLPQLPDPAAPTSDEKLNYQNKLVFLQSLVKESFAFYFYLFLSLY